MSNFVVIDFETANEDISSICQIGIVRYENGIQVDAYESLVNPEDYFAGMNVSIHGIEEEDVESAPTFPEIYKDVENFLKGSLVLSHGWFDRRALEKVIVKYGLSPINNPWLDTTRVVRRALPEYSRKGYGLQNLAKHFDLSTKPHDALDDASTCAAVVIKLLELTNTKIEDWLELVNRPISLGSGSSSYKPFDPKDFEPNPEGEYYGEAIVFTGALSMVRVEAQKLAASLGFTIHNDVKKGTTCLVTGVQEPAHLKGKDKSSKQLKVEKMVADGNRVRIFSESDFMQICKLS
ncbi:3'-5' exoribonuclease [Polynucleobacter sp. AP-Capit-er-40B-B4]|uniref:exonuclease domain-containing protein n=1 Tax=Polynucleobacter sp. AP-Capit-er-40B-B4 TaxID=2576927 RepID=UPI001C0CBBD8|nr:exonuclease domain-containing protein [Polynucleobacter sp. AP-Capit-er-40B-B4]MBU3580779.1 3'-5' exoribonuclease [Polynucleobacter sp. AP-Capit-er-40B-B4]